MKRLCPLLLVLCLLLGGCAQSAPAAETPVPTAAPTLPPAPPEAPYDALPLYFDGLLSGRGYVSGGVAYLPPALLCAYYGLDLEVKEDGERLHLVLPGLDLYGRRGQDYMQAEGRYLYTPGDWLSWNGSIYLPADALAHLFGLDIAVAEDLSRADIGSTGFQLLRGGTDYYTLHYDDDEFFWLCHIIYAEAHWESLAGQIGVGNVVLNRVEAEGFPSTITTVVLDQEHNVQFDPVASRQVLAPPDETAVVAACLCLEGYNTVGGALYFVNPDRGEDGWFRRELTETAVIGSHHFYE